MQILSHNDLPESFVCIEVVVGGLGKERANCAKRTNCAREQERANCAKLRQDWPTSGLLTWTKFKRVEKRDPSTYMKIPYGSLAVVSIVYITITYHSPTVFKYFVTILYRVSQKKWNPHK